MAHEHPAPCRAVYTHLSDRCNWHREWVSSVAVAVVVEFEPEQKTLVSVLAAVASDVASVDPAESEERKPFSFVRLTEIVAAVETKLALELKPVTSVDFDADLGMRGNHRK